MPPRAAVDRSAAAESLLRFEQELGLILKILALDYPSGFQWFQFLREAPLIDCQESMQRIGCVHEIITALD